MKPGESGAIASNFSGRPAPAWLTGRRLRWVALASALLAMAGALGWSRLHHATFHWGGLVEAHAVTVGSRVGGRVKKVVATEGQMVRPGDPLVVLEPGDLEARRVQAAGEVAEREARLEKLSRGAHPEEINQAHSRMERAQANLQRLRAGPTDDEIAEAEARLAAADVEWRKAARDAERADGLYGRNVLSKVARDDARSAEALAQARRDEVAREFARLRKGTRAEDIAKAASEVKEASAGVRLLETMNRAEDIHIAEAQLSVAQGRLQEVEQKLAELTIRAPVVARVEALDLRPGDLLAPDAPAAVLLEDDELFVRLYVPETQLGLLYEGQTLNVEVDTFGGQQFPVVVQRINLQGEYLPRGLQTFDDRANQMFAVRLKISARPGQLRPGMAASVTFVH